MIESKAERTVQVFVRQGCHLCDALLEELHVFRLQFAAEADFAIEVLNIEDQEDWMRYYQHYVPVVVVNGAEVCHYFLDPPELKSALLCL